MRLSNLIRKTVTTITDVPEQFPIHDAGSFRNPFIAYHDTCDFFASRSVYTKEANRDFYVELRTGIGDSGSKNNCTVYLTRQQLTKIRDEINAALDS